MSRTVIALGLVVWAGRRSLSRTRVGHYGCRSHAGSRRPGPRDTDTTQLLADRAGASGIQVARALGVRDDLETRLGTRATLRST